MQNIFTVALPLLATVTTNAATLPFINYKMQGPPPPVEVAFNSNIPELPPVDEKKTATKEVAPEKPKEKRLICKGCNENENVALEYFQNIGIKDRNALATIMGNWIGWGHHGARTSYAHEYASKLITVEV